MNNSKNKNIDDDIDEINDYHKEIINETTVIQDQDDDDDHDMQVRLYDNFNL